MTQTRRAVSGVAILRGVAALLAMCSAILATPRLDAAAQTPPSGQPTKLPFVLTELAPGVYAAIDGPEGRSGSNAGFIIGDDGVVVVDSFSNVAAATALLGEIRRLTPKPVRFVVNTHYHFDHVGGDAVFAEAGAIVIAHRNVRDWVRTENLHVLGERISPTQRATVEKLMQPGLTTQSGLTLWVGARRIDVRFEKGHTGGDLVVSVPDAHVLYCGDLLWRKVSPNVIDGTISDWIATASAFAKAPDAAQTKYVPGHGDVANVTDVSEFVGYLSDLSTFVKAARAAGLSGDALVADVLPKMRAKYGAWAAFNYFAAKEIGFMADELAGAKRIPTPVRE